MKTKPKDLWKRLINEASPPLAPVASEDDVARIVSQLHWQSHHAPAPTWEEALWPLISRLALPGAAALLILATLFPAPHTPPRVDSVDDLIAAATDLP